MKTKLALLAALAISNLIWFGQYRKLQYELGRTEAYLEWSNSIIRAIRIIPAGARPITRDAQGHETIGMPLAEDTPVLTKPDAFDQIEAERNGMPDPTVYQIRKTDIGEARVTCLNGGDATIRPVDEFGQIIVSCGK
jgi:hypothetical protein